MPSIDRSVTFSTVETIEFDRCISRIAVPSEGGWPLGLGSPLGNTIECTIDTFESEKQDRLRQRLNDRLEQCSQKKRRKGRLKQTKKALERLSMSSGPLQSRPWDYKEDDNPLFGMMDEDERKELLVDASQDHEVSVVHKELENLRESRLTKGCSCHHPPTRTRRKKAENGDDGPKCCMTDCICVQAGIRCDFLACQCCNGSNPSPCGNPLRMCLYNEQEVESYRKTLLQRINSASS